MRSIGTPAAEASQSAAIMAGSSSWFILATMPRRTPAALLLDLARDEIQEALAHASWERRGALEAPGKSDRPVRWWKRFTTSAVSAGSHVSNPTSVYSRAVRTW